MYQNFFIYILAISTVLFILLFILLKVNLFNKIDENVYNYFLQYKGSYIYSFFYYFTKLSGEIINIIIFLTLTILLLVKKKFEEIIFLVLFSGTTVFLTIILKYTIRVDRPLNSIGGLSGYAFPSGHAVLSIILAFMLYRLIRNFEITKIKDRYLIAGIVVYILLSLFSRVVIGAHWSSDVIGGLFVGVSFLMLSCYLYAIKFNNRKHIC